jgi:Glycosyltransferase family 87
VPVAVCAALAWPSSSPLEPLNAGHPTGDSAWAWAFLACAAAAVAAYGLGLLVLRRRAPRLAAVAALAVAIQLAPLAAPLLLSTDAWAYWDYGRIATVHDGNPYRDSPGDFPDDPAFAYSGSEWRDATTVYGPAFTLASEPLAVAAGTSANAAAWIYKSLAAVAILAATACVGLLARRKSFAVAFAGWNPLLAIHLAGGGHNDAWVAALVLGAMALASVGRLRLAGAAWALAVLVKWVPLLLLPLRALEARATGRRVEHAGFAVTALLVAIVATAAYGFGWLEAAGPLARTARSETRYAVPHRLAQLGLPHWLAVGGMLLAFAVAYVWLLREAARGRARLGLTLALLLLAVPYLTPWYLAWVVPLAAADEDPPAELLAFGLSAYLLPQTVPI